jgi:putative Holliday junction resolvase
MRYMGIDLGTKYIGVAVSDESGTIAQAREVVERTSNKDAIKRIKEIISEYDVQEVVIGLPLNMNGSQGSRADDSVRFAERLAEATDLEVRLWDERLSTKEVTDVMIKASVRRDKRKKKVDKLAAQLILQSYLDSL